MLEHACAASPAAKTQNADQCCCLSLNLADLLTHWLVHWLPVESFSVAHVEDLTYS